MIVFFSSNDCFSHKYRGILFRKQKDHGFSADKLYKNISLKKQNPGNLYFYKLNRMVLEVKVAFSLSALVAFCLAISIVLGTEQSEFGWHKIERYNSSDERYRLLVDGAPKWFAGTTIIITLIVAIVNIFVL